jgi:UDP-glucose 6-dehydrogenase
LYKNNISIIGTGYVGLVGGVCLANFGNNIINVDIDAEKIDKLNKGEIPIYEAGLEDMLEKNVREDRITFTTDVESAIKESEVIFISVGTPPAEDGSADLSHVLDVAHTIGKNMNDYKVVVDKSTVPIGTGRKVQKVIQSELDNRGVDYNFDVVSNPEFLREGKAVYDFTHPDRIIIGTESEKARDILSEVYRALYLNDVTFVFTNLETDDMRESPALTILPKLIERGAKIRAYDPEAIKEATWRLEDYEQDIIYCANEYEVMKASDALVLITEWNQFRRLDLNRVKNLLAELVFFDFINVYESEEVEKYGIDYIGVGVPGKKK